MNRNLDRSALQILARSIAQELQDHDYSARHIVALAHELIGLARSLARDRPGLSKKPM
jgi:hypothetical protein